MPHGNVCQGAEGYEGTAVCRIMIVGTLHQHTLHGEVAQLQVYVYRSVQVGKHGLAECLISESCCFHIAKLFFRFSSIRGVIEIRLYVLVAPSTYGEHHHLAGAELQFGQHGNGMGALYGGYDSPSV